MMTHEVQNRRVWDAAVALDNLKMKYVLQFPKEEWNRVEDTDVYYDCLYTLFEAALETAYTTRYTHNIYEIPLGENTSLWQAEVIDRVTGQRVWTDYRRTEEGAIDAAMAYIEVQKEHC